MTVSTKPLRPSPRPTYISPVWGWFWDAARFVHHFPGSGVGYAWTFNEGLIKPTLNGTVPKADSKFGNAPSFPGTNTDYINFDNSSVDGLVTNENDFTVFALVATDDSATTNQRAVISTESTGPDEGWQIVYNASLTADRFQFVLLDTGSQVNSSFSDAPTAGQYYALAARAAFSAGWSLDFFIDGTESLNSTLANGLGLGDAADQFFVGTRRTTSGNSFDGKVAFLAVLNGARTDAQIAQWSADPMGPLLDFATFGGPIASTAAGGGSPQTIAATQATETDTALAATFSPGALTVAATQATSTETALSATASLSLVVTCGIATETGAGLTATASPGALTVAAGQAAETGAGLAATVSLGALTVAAGLVTETDAALSATVSTASVITAGIATEADAPLSATVGLGALTVAVGQATETNAALSATLATGTIITTGIAAETDAPLSATVVVGAITITAGQAVETSAPLAVTPALSLTVATGQAAETNAVLSALVVAAITITAGLASETGSALTIQNNGIVTGSTVALADAAAYAVVLTDAAAFGVALTDAAAFGVALTDTTL